MTTPSNQKESVCKVGSIYFNYFQAERELFQNPNPEYGMNVIPEGISRYPTIPFNAVAFAMDATDPNAYPGDPSNKGYNRKLKLHVEFKGTPNSSLLIRTVDPSEQEVEGLDTYLERSQVNLKEVGKPTKLKRLLGDVEPIKINFCEKGNSFVEGKNQGVIELTIDSADIWSHGICASWQLWQWQYSTDEGKTWEIAEGLFYEGISIHRIYVTKNVPTWPWTGYNEEVKTVSSQSVSSRWPYIGALEWACKWAVGETTEEGIAAKITAGINDGSGDRFKYDETGANNYSSGYHKYFDCGRFIDRLNGKFGRGPNVNCVDCAYMVIALANALGCNLQPGRINNIDNNLNFVLNPITLIGNDELSPPGATFNFHQIALIPSSDANTPDRVFDACLKFDEEVYKNVQGMSSAPNPSDPLPAEMAHQHPVDIPIGTNVFTYGYLAILAQSVDEPSQNNLKLYKGDTQTFGISALMFYK